jgi:hypothetical protein
LLARAQIDGEVRQPGYVFTLAEGERSPHRTVVASNIGDGLASLERAHACRRRVARRLDYARRADDAPRAALRTRPITQTNRNHPMTNTQQLDDDWPAPLRRRRDSVRELEARFKNAGQTIKRYRPDEEIGDFPPSAGAIETMHWGELGVHEVLCQLSVKVVEQRADELVAEAEEAERIRVESQRQQNMSPLEAKIERLERALAYQGAELAKLKGVQSGSLPGLPHVARADTPQMLGLPKGMGRHPVGQTAGSGVRKLGSGSVSEPDAMGAGFTWRIQPLEVIGGGGRR